MELASLARERVDAHAVGTGQIALDWPETGSGIGLKAARVVTLHGQQIGIAQIVVVLQAFGESRHQFALRGEIRGAFQLLLDPIRHGDFLSVQLKAGKLIVLLVDHLLQILVAGAETIGFLAQRVVLGDLPGHSGVAGHETECGETTQESKSQNGVDGLVGNMNAPQATAQGVGYKHDEIFLLH